MKISPLFPISGLILLELIKLAHLYLKSTNSSHNRENVDEDILELGTGRGKVEVDIMSPLDPEKSPKVHKPNLNHIGLWVDDLQACYDFLSNEKGVKMAGGIRKGASGHNVAFVHPKSACGVLVELVQAPPEVIQHFSS